MCATTSAIPPPPRVFGTFTSSAEIDGRRAKAGMNMSTASFSIWTSRVASASRRSGSVAVTLLGLLLLTFFIGRVMPLDPVLAIVGPDADASAYAQIGRAHV